MELKETGNDVINYIEMGSEGYECEELSMTMESLIYTGKIVSQSEWEIQWYSDSECKSYIQCVQSIVCNGADCIVEEKWSEVYITSRPTTTWWHQLKFLRKAIHFHFTFITTPQGFERPRGFQTISILYTTLLNSSKFLGMTPIRSWWQIEFW